ncbi:MAG: tRNA (guanine(46)-N(7))-methyltransferase TrmB [Brevinema sp.]
MRRFPARDRAEAMSLLQFSEDLPQHARLCMDMGCGTGDFLLHMCPKDPSTLWLGVDIAHDRVQKTAVRLHRRYVDNVRLHCGDGQDFLASLPEGCLSEIHMNFPDPWLKTRQWKNRLFRPSFALDILRALKPEGEFYFVSDIAEYAHSVADLLTPFPGWKSLYEPVVQQNIFQDFPTLFYRKMSPLRPISYLSFKKI